MKKRDAMNWINALRSGKYEQCSGTLRSYGRYCCLGVLCELYPELTLDASPYNFHTDEAILPSYERIGLRGARGDLADGVFTLAELNDRGYSFDEIADIIQIEYIEGL